MRVKRMIIMYHFFSSGNYHKKCELNYPFLSFFLSLFFLFLQENEEGERMNDDEKEW